MTKQEHAAKLRLIADIIEKDLPFEVSTHGGPFKAPLNEPVYYACIQNRAIRIKPEPAPPVMIPLSYQDVPPGSVLRKPNYKPGIFHAVLFTTNDGITIGAHGTIKFVDYESLKLWYEIKRPGEDWQPCHKVQS